MKKIREDDLCLPKAIIKLFFLKERMCSWKEDMTGMSRRSWREEWKTDMTEVHCVYTHI